MPGLPREIGAFLPPWNLFCQRELRAVTLRRDLWRPTSLDDPKRTQCALLFYSVEQSGEVVHWSIVAKPAATRPSKKGY